VSPLGCSETSCDEFLLDIQVPPDPDAAKKAFVTLDLRADEPLQAAVPFAAVLVVYPPGATNLADDYEVFFPGGYRMVEPPQGVWRIRTVCVSCSNTKYTVVAKTGTTPVVSSPLPPRGPVSFTNVRLPLSGSGEPGVVVDGDGRVFVDAPFTRSGPTIFRSLDRGLTFTRKNNFDRVPIRNGSTDSNLDVAPDDGTVYAVNKNALEPTGVNTSQSTALVYVSEDHGDTYARLPAWSGSLIDRPWLAAAPDGVVYLANVAVLDVGLFAPDLQTGGPSVLLWRSADHGKTFLLRSIINLGQAGAYAGPASCSHSPRSQIDPRDPDTIYVFYRSSPPDDCIFDESTTGWLAKSTDAGLTWTHSQITGGGGAITQSFRGTADPAGTLYASWSENAPNGESHIWMKSSADGGVTWNGPFRVDQLDGQIGNVLPAIQAPEPGRVDIAWYTAQASDTSLSDATWTVAFARSLDAAGESPHFSQSRVSADVVRTVPNIRPFNDFLGLDIDPDGRANVVWMHDVFGQTLTYYGKEIAG
jgi:hypothetical protein